MAAEDSQIGMGDEVTAELHGADKIRGRTFPREENVRNTFNESRLQPGAALSKLIRYANCFSCRLQ